MKKILSHSSLLGALLLLPGFATLAQDPQPYRTVAYSAEELDNLVAPVALYPDALLAQILVAATFPEQIAIAAQYVRERGTRGVDDQGWDISVRSVAHYPPVLNMLANQEDWATALGQAYASQSGDVMDAIQRLREMAREQGNLVSTREHIVQYDRDRIIIVPANPQVIYVPTYDPYVVYYRPIFAFGFHTGYFSFGIGFPIGSWLVYDVDWWGRRVYYDGWYGYDGWYDDGWRYHARRYFTMYPVYVRPRYSVVNININIFSRRVNYINLDRRYRYVRRDVSFERHHRGGDRYADRDGWRDDDRRGPYGDGRDGWSDGDNRPQTLDNGGRQGGGRNDRIGNRTATFDDFRPDKGRNAPDARDAEPTVSRSGFGGIEKQRQTGQSPQGRAEKNGAGRSKPTEFRGTRPTAPVFTSQPRSVERSKSNGNGGGSTSEFRGARPSAPVFSSPPRSVERSKSNAYGGGLTSEFRGPRPNAPVYSSPPRSVERKSGGNGRPSASEFRGSRPSAPVYTSQPRSVERKGGGGYGGGQMSAPSMRVAPSRPSKPSGSPSMTRSPSGGGSGKVRASGGGGGGGGNNRGGGGKGRR